jgi:hypothetical protein
MLHGYLFGLMKFIFVYTQGDCNFPSVHASVVVKMWTEVGLKVNLVNPE